MSTRPRKVHTVSGGKVITPDTGTGRSDKELTKKEGLGLKFRTDSLLK
jgi:hypothetical protein